MYKAPTGAPLYFYAHNMALEFGSDFCKSLVLNRAKVARVGYWNIVCLARPDDRSTRNMIVMMTTMMKSQKWLWLKHFKMQIYFYYDKTGLFWFDKGELIIKKELWMNVTILSDIWVSVFIVTWKVGSSLYSNVIIWVGCFVEFGEKWMLHLHISWLLTSEYTMLLPR